MGLSASKALPDFLGESFFGQFAPMTSLTAPVVAPTLSLTAIGVSSESGLLTPSEAPTPSVAPNPSNGPSLNAPPSQSNTPSPNTSPSQSNTPSINTSPSQSNTPSLSTAPSQSTTLSLNTSSRQSIASQSIALSQSASTTTTVDISINVSLTATLSPEGGIASTSNTEPLTAVAATAVAISSFLLLIAVTLVILLCYRRKQRREDVEPGRDSWADSVLQPEITRASRSQGRRTDHLKTAMVPEDVPPIPSPKNIFLRAYERAAALPHMPTVVNETQKARGSRVQFEEMGMRNGNGNGIGGGVSDPMMGRASRRMSSASDESPLTRDEPSIPAQQAVPRRAYSQFPTTKSVYGNQPRKQNSVRRPGFRNSDAAIRPEQEELPESLGRLNRWLDENRRRSQL